MTDSPQADLEAAQGALAKYTRYADSPGSVYSSLRVALEEKAIAASDLAWKARQRDQVLRERDEAVEKDTKYLTSMVELSQQLEERAERAERELAELSLTLRAAAVAQHDIEAERDAAWEALRGLLIIHIGDHSWQHAALEAARAVLPEYLPDSGKAGAL